MWVGEGEEEDLCFSGGTGSSEGAGRLIYDRKNMKNVLFYIDSCGKGGDGFLELLGRSGQVRCSGLPNG